MKKIFPFLLALALQAAPLPSSYSSPEAHTYTFRPLDNTGFFNYLTVGTSTQVTTNILQNTLPNFTYGRRYLYGSFGLDSSIGARFGEYNQCAYLQSSYLLYLFEPNKLYLGFGFEGGVHRRSPAKVASKTRLHYDMPLTIGYQFANSERRKFLQLQAYPRTSTSDRDLHFAASYGFGF